MRAHRTLSVAVLVLASACDNENLNLPPPPATPFNMSGGWHVVETEVNADLVTCTLEYDMTLSQDMAGTVSGVTTANERVLCHLTPKTAADSALARVDPMWGLTYVSIARVSVYGYLAVRTLRLDLGTSAWHISGTQHLESGQSVIGTATKNDGELPAGSPWSGTFKMVRVGAGV